MESRCTSVQKRGAVGFILTTESMEIGKNILLGKYKASCLGNPGTCMGTVIFNALFARLVKNLVKKLIEVRRRSYEDA